MSRKYTKKKGRKKKTKVKRGGALTKTFEPEPEPEQYDIQEPVLQPFDELPEQSEFFSKLDSQIPEKIDGPMTYAEFTKLVEPGAPPSRGNVEQWERMYKHYIENTRRHHHYQYLDQIRNYKQNPDIKHPTFVQQTLASKSRNQVIPQLEKEKKEYPFEEYLKDVFEELYRDSYNETISERIADKKDVSQTMRTNMVQTMKDVMEDGMIRNKTYGHTSGWTKINNVIPGNSGINSTFIGNDLQINKDRALKLGKNMISESPQIPGNYMICNVIFNNNTILVNKLNRDIYIAPGTPFKLLKQKEIEGFEVEYDPIDK